jgi:hypothetical protein
VHSDATRGSRCARPPAHRLRMRRMPSSSSRGPLRRPALPQARLERGSVGSSPRSARAPATSGPAAL